MPSSEFVFALCQRGAEATLKRELGRTLPGWAPAYQRPGLVTFRVPAAVTPELLLSSVFARSWGMSLGQARGADELLARIADVHEPLCLHVIERDLHRPDEEPKGFVRGELGRVVARELRARAGERFTAQELARPGELVLDVIVAPEDPWLVGLHRQTEGRCPHPGGRYPVEVPLEAPSRAYAKIEAAIQAFALPVQPGHTAVELGAAPGGAAYALCRRGVSVVAVDPAAMDPRVLDFTGPSFATVRHLALPMAALQRHQLPARVDWLLMDVHLAPQVALRSVARIASLLRPTLRGVVLTLKLNDWSFADKLDRFVAQVRELGVVDPQARQLASHRQEIVIAGRMRRQRTPRRRPG